MTSNIASASSNMTEPHVALRCTGLVKRYPDVTAVDGIDLSVRTGECFGILGPNGAGKTTTVEIFEGLTKPDGGTVEVLGQSWGKGQDRALRNRFGVQLQETQLTEKLTVRETVKLFRSFYTRGRDVESIISLVELNEKQDSRVGKLSGGQKQRLALACALVGDPELLFLDEPTTGLDPQARLKLWDIVEQFRAGGGSIVLTTHYMEEAARLCDRVGVMDHGRVIALDTPTRLIESLGADQIVEFSVKGEMEEDALGKLAGVRSVRAASDGYALTVADIGSALPALLAEIEHRRVELVTLTTHQATLEDVFVSLTGRMLRDA
ncbi:MAG TPA: ABC transporter ATP-binding protein [Pyrinomonadaceae bacterium]|nr:ABC transporter ATP-binding protein [Pyrinomonadaceae bacterium]